MLLDRLKATGRIFALFLGVFALASAAQAGPEDGRIVNGSGSISQSGTHTDIRQNSDFLATHWGSFNIAAHESVQAHQPDASSRLLIRVDGGGGATNIAGTFTANGITILENRNGVQFSRGAIVNVGGLLATSSRISGVSGANWQLNGTGGAVVNHGQIVAGAGGAILAAVKVQNTGDIISKGGDVALGAGSAFTVDFAGSMVGFEITQAASGASITNTGKIESQGGIVSLSAQEAQAVRTNVVSVGGVVKATKLERRGGVVYLSGGTQGIAEVSGDVSASDKVQTTGEYVVVKEGALLKAPEILVGGDFQGGGDVPTSRRTLVERGALLDAGAEGRVIVWSDETTWFNGNISAPGGFAEVSGKETLASVHLAGIDVGELLLDPVSITIDTTGTTTLTASPNGDIAAADSGGDLILGAADIGDYAGDLSLAATGAITVNVAITKTTGNLTLDAGGVLTLGANITTSAGDLALTGASMALSGAATLTGAAITITAPTINIDTHALTITASGALTLATVGMITGTGTAALSLTGDTIAGLSTALTLNVPTVNLELTDEDSSFSATAPFATNSGITTLNITTNEPATALLEYRDWMAAMGRNLTITTTAGISIGSTAINLGMGNLTLNSQVGIVLTNAAGLTITVGDFMFFTNDGFLSSSEGIDVSHFVVMAGGDITTSSINLGAVARVELLADNGSIIADLGSFGGRPLIRAGVLLMRQMGIFADSFFNTTSSVVTGSVSFRVTGAGVDQTIHPWMTALGTGDFSLRGEGVVLASITLPAGTLTRTGDIDLQATAITLTAATTLTGGAISLTGAITASNNLTIMASGVLTLNSDINIGTNALTLTSGAGAIVGAGRPRLTAGMVSLAQVDAFPVTRTLRVIPGSSLAITTEAPQDVHDWMIRENIDLTVTSSNRVRVVAIIGSGGVAGRNLGTGNITLTSTGGTVRILADITTDGNITLSGVTGGINFNSGAGAKALTGAIITLTGDARSDRDLALNATNISGALTLNGGINTGTSALSLSGSGGITLGSALTLTGGAITLTGAAMGADSLTITASGTLTLNNNINLTGAVLTLALSGAGAIGDGSSTAVLTASTVRLRQVDAFGSMQSPFDFGNTGFLALTTDAAQDVHDWMILTDRNLTVTSAGNVVVRSAIGSGNRNLGTGSLTLESTGAVVRILGGISTTGDVTITASGTLTIDSDINIGANALTLTSGAGAIVGAGRPRLTAGMVSLAQVDAFPVTRTLRVIPGSSLAITTEAAQDVHDWMIRENIGLTVTSSNRVRVVAIIGTGGAAGRNLGTGALSLTSTGGAVRILADITTGGNITLIGVTGGINFNSGAGAKTLSGGTVTLNGNARSDRDLTLNATNSGGALMLSGEIVLTGTSALSLSGVGGITLGGSLTLTGGSITISNTVGGTTNANLTITTSGTLTLDSNITLTGTGILDLMSRQGAITGSAILIAPTVRLRQVAVFDLAPPFNFSTTPSLELTTDAEQVVHNWMIVASGRNLTITSSDRVVVEAAIGPLETGRNLGGGDLTLRSTGAVVRILENISTTGNITLSGAGAIVGVGTPELTASTVSLTQAEEFAASAVFGFAATSLELTTTVNQEVYNWMILENTDLTVESPGRVRVSAEIVASGGGARDIGTGDLTLTSTGGLVRILANITTGGAITLSGGGTDGINLDSTATSTGTVTLTGAAITLTGNVVSNRALALDASDTLRINSNITLTGAGNLTLSSDTVVRILAGDISVGGNITLSGGTGGINFNNGAAAKTLSGVDIEITGDARSNRDLAITASGVLTLNGGINTGTSALSLSGSSVALGGALTLTGGDITFTGAATGTASLTITASGTLTLNNDINIGTSALTLTSGVGAIVATGRPRLTAGMVSLAQIDAFPVTRTLRVIPGSSLAITTEAAQDVHDWMIRENIDLTVTSSNRVRVAGAIGDGLGGRDLGTGALSLTSTGGAVRILANISTTGGLTLSGVTGGINLNGGAAKTLAGAIITLTGDARGNSALTLNATDGVLTINNNINIGTAVGALLTLTATGGFMFAPGVDLTAGDYAFPPSPPCDGSTMPSCTTNTP